MTTVFQSFIDMAIQMINENGMLVTLRQITPGAPAITGEDWNPTDGTNVDTPVKMIFFPEETIDKYPFVRIPYELRGQGFEFALMANNPGVPVPSIEDVIIRGTDQLRLRYSKPYAPDGTPILYVLGIKT